MAVEKGKGKNIGIVLLAAGASVRLGRPKQLLQYHGQSLLKYCIQNARASNAQPVVVVLGANANGLQNETNERGIHVVVNEVWQEGMSSSIRSGIKTITQLTPEVEGIILMVSDQPYVTITLINELIGVHEKSGKQIVACSYGDTFGPPAFFHHSLFDELLRLKGDIGARSIVQQHTDTVEVIPFAEGTVDIDTEADYEKIK